VKLNTFSPMKPLLQRLTWMGLLSVALTGHAGFDAYLKIEGVDGEAEDKSDGHKKWIDLLSFSSPFRPGGPVAPPVTALEFTKQVDKASPLLFSYCAAGTTSPWARLELVQTNPAVVRVFDIRMSNVLVTAASVMSNPASADDRPTETLSLNFTKIEWTYTTARPASRLPAELRSASWDSATSLAAGSTNTAAFTVTGIRENSGSAVLNWQGVAGRTYDIYACPSLDGAFSFQGQVVATADGPMNHTAPLHPGAMFFAVEERP